MHECTELSSSTNPLFHANSPFTLYSFFGGFVQTAVPEKARRPESSSHPKIVFWRIWAIRKSGKSPRTLISQRKRLICIYTLPLQTETQEFLSSVLADLCKSPPVRIPHHRSAPGNETIFGLQIAASFGKIQPKQSGFARDRADSVRNAERRWRRISNRLCTAKAERMRSAS